MLICQIPPQITVPKDLACLAKKQDAPKLKLLVPMIWGLLLTTRSMWRTEVIWIFETLSRGLSEFLGTVSSVSIGWVASRGCSEAVTAAACSVVPMCPPLPTALPPFPLFTTSSCACPAVGSSCFSARPAARCAAAPPHHC